MILYLLILKEVELFIFLFNFLFQILRNKFNLVKRNSEVFKKVREKARLFNFNEKGSQEKDELIIGIKNNDFLILLLTHRRDKF